jgi:hypothetical protein
VGEVRREPKWTEIVGLGGECPVAAILTDWVQGDDRSCWVQRQWIYMGDDLWTECDGTLFSSVVYPRLFALLGTTYGGAVSLGLFKVPDTRGLMLVGGITGGEHD